jgi:hypothetical protein
MFKRISNQAKKGKNALLSKGQRARPVPKWYYN